MENLNVSPAPHLTYEDTSKSIVSDVIIALIPLAVAGCLTFGWYSALVIATCILTCVVLEFTWCQIMKIKSTIGDLSAVLTGLLLALSLPPRLPLWIAAIGGAIAIVGFKLLLGKIGFNIVNSVIAARVVLSVAFKNAMHTWIAPAGGMGKYVSSATSGEIDILAGATPLSDTALKGGYYNSYKSLFMGQVPGCIGETFSLLIVIGFLYLLLRRVITPVIPISMVGTVALLSFVFGQSPIYMMLSGGLMLAAVFMATDYKTRPIGALGQLIFGIGCGAITFVIRRFTPLPEGVAVAILVMNLLVPLINRITRPKPFGLQRAKKDEIS